MPRTLTRNNNDELVFTEKAYDDDQDDLTHPLTGKVELDQVDGVSQSGADRHPAWLSAVVNEIGVANSRWEEEVTVTIDATQLAAGTTYTFLFRADDGKATTDLTRDLVVQALQVAGTQLFVADSGSILTDFAASSAFDTTTLSETRELDTSGDNGGAWGVSFSVNGKWMYVADAAAGEILEYNLSTAWDVSSASLNHTFSPSAGTINGVVLANNGTNLFYVDAANVDVVRLDMGGPGDLSAATEAKRADVSGNSADPVGLAIEDDGTRMIVTDGTDDSVHSWDLTTGYNPETLSSHASTNPGSTGTLAGIDFNSDGTKMYLVDAGGAIDEYDLSTAYDESSLSHTNEHTFSSVANNVRGIFWGGT